MKKLFFSLIILFIVNKTYAQFPNDKNGRLALLCKTWGYLKYHHPNKCNIQWNDLLLSKIDSAYGATTNNAFNDILFNMCAEAGFTTAPLLPTIITSDTAKNYHTNWFNDPVLSLPVQQYLDSVEAHAIVDTNNYCIVRYNDYSDPNYYSLIDFRIDSINNIPGFSFSNLSHRVLTYFYYWNSINYFFPQVAIADNHWDSTLYQFMLPVITTNNDSTFHMALAQVVSRIDDSHGAFGSFYLQKYLSDMPNGGTYYTNKIALARIENKNVVVQSGIPSINQGDIINKINGRNVDSLFQEHSKYIAASNLITKYRNFYTNIFDGTFSSTKTIELIDANNNAVQTSFACNVSYTNYYNWLNAQDTASVWKIMKCGYGYVHMGKLDPSDVSVMYNDLKNAPAIIFDIRNYPNGTLWDLKPLLFPSPNISANYLLPDLSYPGYCFVENDIDNFGTWNNATPYTGKVIILVNEQTQSQAEYTAQALRTYPNAIVIGSQSAGADGNICWLDLPGGIRTLWSGLGWYQANWYNPQRAGVQVDSVVHPTIAGIRNGVDEVLEKAFDCALQVPNNEIAIGVQMLQTNHSLYIENSTKENYKLIITNLQGQKLYDSPMQYKNMEYGFSNLPTGLYIASIHQAGKINQSLKFSVR